MSIPASERPSCYLCGELAVRVKWRGRASTPLTAEAVRCTTSHHGGLPDVLECAACGMQYLASDTETDQKLLACYGDVVDETYLNNESARRLTYSRVMKSISPLLPAGAKLVEGGSYCGFFLDEAAKCGFKVSGIELSRWAAGYSAGRFGYPVLNASLTEAGNLLKEKYDAAVLWDVIEHLTDPRSDLRAMNTLLEPGGLVFISTMDVGALLPRILERRWPWYMPMHRFYFNRATMGVLLQQAGFSLIDARPYVHYVTLAYLLTKLTGRAGEKLRLPAVFHALGMQRLVIPFYLGDIKIFVGKKIRDPL